VAGRIIVLAVWYFGGAVMLVAGYSLIAAVVCTLGALAFWQWRSRDLDEYGEHKPPPIPEARVRR
jgi:hypothetical protein